VSLEGGQLSTAPRLARRPFAGLEVCQLGGRPGGSATVRDPRSFVVSPWLSATPNTPPLLQAMALDQTPDAKAQTRKAGSRPGPSRPGADHGSSDMLAPAASEWFGGRRAEIADARRRCRSLVTAQMHSLVDVWDEHQDALAGPKIWAGALPVSSIALIQYTTFAG
jgi:hypothetical protein